MEKKDQLVIFDYDGTLLDSMDTYAEIASSLFEFYFKMPIEIGLEAYHATAGMPFRHQLEIISPGSKFNNEINKRYHNQKKEIRGSLKLFPEVVPLFEKLQKDRLVAIVSSNDHEFVTESVRQHGLNPSWVTGTGDYINKLMQIKAVMEKFQPLSYTMYVGDSAIDEDFAMVLKLPFIGVDRKGTSLIQSTTVKSLEDLCQILPSIIHTS